MLSSILFSAGGLAYLGVKTWSERAMLRSPALALASTLLSLSGGYFVNFTSGGSDGARYEAVAVSMVDEIKRLRGLVEETKEIVEETRSNTETIIANHELEIELTEEQLAKSDQILIMLTAALDDRRQNNKGAVALADPFVEVDIAGALQHVLKLVRAGDTQLGKALEQGDVTTIASKLKDDLDRDWAAYDQARPEIEADLINRAHEAAALAFANGELQDAERFGLRILELNESDPAALNSLGQIALERERWEQAESWFSRLVLSDTTADWQFIGWFNWGYALGKRADTVSGDERSRLLGLSIEKFERAAGINPGDALAWANWGVALRKFAEGSSGMERTRLYGLSFEKYERATQLDPSFAYFWSDWGFALANFAESASGDERARLYGMSIEKYERAIQVDPSVSEFWVGWGASLGNLAKTSKGLERARLLGLSMEKYERAAKLDPENAVAWSNWGFALGQLADISTDIERARLLGLSMEKYERATQADPEYVPAWINWGNRLRMFAHNAKGDERTRFLDESIEKYERANQADPGDSTTLRALGEVLRLRAMDARKVRDQDLVCRYLLRSLESFEQAGASTATERVKRELVKYGCDG